MQVFQKLFRIYLRNLLTFISILRNLHDSMFKNILRSKMRIFHINPVGRVLNRFSQDMGTVDGQLIVYVAYVSAVSSGFLLPPEKILNLMIFYRSYHSL